MELGAGVTHELLKRTMHTRRTSAIATMSSDVLRRIWMGSTVLSGDEAKLDRDEALWEYWRRGAFGQVQFVHAELESAFVTGVRGVANVVGELARQGRTPVEQLGRARVLLTELTPDEAAWALTQVTAREALESLKGTAKLEGEFCWKRCRPKAQPGPRLRPCLTYLQMSANTW
jgi:hypothetical protein